MSTRSRRVPDGITDENGVHNIQSSSQTSKYTVDDRGHCTIAEGIKIISSNVFGGNTNMKYITFPTSLEYIGQSAFSHASVEKIKFQNPIILAPSAFSNCDKLVSVEFFEGSAAVSASA